VGGVDAALSATPFFTAHTYSLDSMTPTAPRMDLPNPFQPPKGRGALDARRCKAKPGEALTQAGTALRVSQIIDSLFYLSAGDCCPGHRDILVLRRAHYLCPDCSDLSMVTVVQAIVQYT
jgi:hypothetical protein